MGSSHENLKCFRISLLWKFSELGTSSGSFSE